MASAYEGLSDRKADKSGGTVVNIHLSKLDNTRGSGTHPMMSTRIVLQPEGYLVSEKGKTSSYIHRRPRRAFPFSYAIRHECHAPWAALRPLAITLQFF